MSFSRNSERQMVVLGLGRDRVAGAIVNPSGRVGFPVLQI
jgi:hypothetical protein